MQQFNILKDSELPYLEIEPIVNGRYYFKKLFYAIQDATVTFSMKNQDTEIYKIANAPAYIVPDEDGNCEEKFRIQYRWKKRDTKEKGRFLAQFKIKFNGDTVKEGMLFPKGELLVPISEPIVVNIM